ncbi:ExbD/TolR family protein [Allosphingosinicella sp.]|jgi:biopolymer transport protein ExbD|uniref:ExbD/TolR family protein n=1 Tax=Allosphingosinicella sp. TaxID=2823234 RepID=UPI002EF69DD4
MAINVGQNDGEDTPMSDINTTPLVDVMLVLLIIFLITIPVVIQTVPLDLPKVEHLPTTTTPQNVNLSVKAGGGGECEVYWELGRVTSDELFGKAEKALTDEIERLGGPENISDEEIPEVHIRGDVNTPYRCIGGTIFTMQRAGFTRVAFISEPLPKGGAK